MLLILILLVTLGVQNKRRRVVRGEDVKIKRPEQFVRENRIKEGSLNKMNRRKKQAEKRKNANVPKNKIKNTIGLIVRIHGGRHSNNDIKKELTNMKLNNKYDAVFIKLDEDTIKKLSALDAYLAYGYISHKSVIELVHRRAYYLKGGKRSPLSDNLTVEKALGDKNILCLNDLSHEIFNLGPNFDHCNNMLSTFQLSAPIGHYEKKILQNHDEVEEKGGFLGEKMEDFLNKIL